MTREEQIDEAVRRVLGGFPDTALWALGVAAKVCSTGWWEQEYPHTLSAIRYEFRKVTMGYV